MKQSKRPSFLSLLISILLLPFNVTVIIPALFLFFFQYTYGFGAPLLFQELFLFTGVIFIIAGLTLVVLTVKHFATRGKGTLAPWNPPKKLVVSGPYQYTRNPMISGVACILFGESLLFGSFPILLWFIFFTSANYIYFIKVEEPLLTRKFGDEYIAYKNTVPRLLPKQNKS